LGGRKQSETRCSSGSCQSPVIQSYSPWFADIACLIPPLILALEWSSGYTIKFGVTHINYKTLGRTPKESALKIRAMIEGRMNAKVQGA
jgi:hypothetical protein